MKCHHVLQGKRQRLSIEVGGFAGVLSLHVRILQRSDHLLIGHSEEEGVVKKISAVAVDKDADVPCQGGGDTDIQVQHLIDKLIVHRLVPDTVSDQIRSLFENPLGVLQGHNVGGKRDSMLV